MIEEDPDREFYYEINRSASRVPVSLHHSI